MRITQWGEYGVHCLVFIAERHRAGQATVSASEIAAAQDIDPLYAQQILQRLRRTGLIASVRGKQGGYKLGRLEEEITLGDILVAAEGETFTVICDAKPLSSSRCGDDSDCGLRGIWHDLRDHVDQFLSMHTLAELVERAEKRPALVSIGGNRVG